MRRDTSCSSRSLRQLCGALPGVLPESVEIEFGIDVSCVSMEPVAQDSGGGVVQALIGGPQIFVLCLLCSAAW